MKVLMNNLIIFPDNLSVNRKSKNIFIDQFCFDNFKNHKNFEYKIYNNNLSIKKNKIENFELTNRVFFKVIEKIRDQINKIHQINFNTNEYEILIGAWLRVFIQQLIYKYKLIEEVFNNISINSISLLNCKNYNYYVSETKTINDATNDLIWSSNIYSEIINYKKFNLNINLIENLDLNFNDKFFRTNKLIKNRTIRQIIKNKFTYFNKYFPNNANMLFFDTGLPAFLEKFLELSFFQLPRFYNTRYFYETSEYNLELRKKLKFNLFEKEEIDFELLNLVIYLLPKSLPLFILEDFNKIEKLLKKNYLPQKPKYIFTSYAFDHNELFKLYLAKQKNVNKELKYFIYQHGGNYITKLDNRYKNECITADYLVTWGNKIDNKLNNNLPFYNFKLLNNLYFKKNKKQNFTILLRSSGYNSTPHDRYLEGKKEVDSVCKFLKLLPEKIKNCILIRAHPSNKGKLDYNEKIINKFKVDYGNQNYFETINNSKLILFNYDSTGMLETLCANKPTLCLVPDLKNQINYEVEEDYKLLKDAKILFENSDQLIQHVDNIWHNIDNWWSAEKTQYCIKKFIDLYSRKPNKMFFKELRNLITKS